MGSKEHACLQVYISYGQKTSGQLLLSYGFMPAPGSNPHDACLLELSLAEDDPCYQAKAACLRQYGAEPAREFPLRLDAIPQALLLFAAFRDARPKGAAEVMALAKQLLEEVGLGGSTLVPPTSRSSCRMCPNPAEVANAKDRTAAGLQRDGCRHCDALPVSQNCSLAGQIPSAARVQLGAGSYGCGAARMPCSSGALQQH